MSILKILLLLQNNGKKMKRQRFFILFMVTAWSVVLATTMVDRSVLTSDGLDHHGQPSPRCDAFVRGPSGHVNFKDLTLLASQLQEAPLAAHNWMHSLNDDVSLSQLSIPGTHNSGARYETWPGTSQCQDLSIDEQLEAGVRFLDIRCCHRNNTFRIYHGMEDQHLSFDDVLDTCISFLRSERRPDHSDSNSSLLNPFSITRNSFSLSLMIKTDRSLL